MKLSSMFQLDMFRRRGRASCIQVARVIQRYLDDQLDEGTAQDVVRHLKACRRCGLDVDSYRAMKFTLAQSSRAAPPERVERLTSFVAQLVSESRR